MTVKFFNYNLVNQSPTVITASSENAFFPVSNLKDDRRTKVFRSTGPTAVLVFDFVSTEQVDSIILTTHIKNGFGFITPVLIEANPTDTWASPAYTTTLTGLELDSQHGVAYKDLVTAQSYRFWRLTFSGASYVELSKVFIGKKQLIGAGRSINYGWQFLDNDNSIVQINRYGQKFIDELPSQKRIGASFSNLTKDEIDDFFSVYDYNQKTKPFFMYFDCDILNNNKRLFGYYYLDEKPTISNPFFSLYNLDLVTTEGM